MLEFPSESEDRTSNNDDSFPKHYNSTRVMQQQQQQQQYGRHNQSHANLHQSYSVNHVLRYVQSDPQLARPAPSLYYEADPDSNNKNANKQEGTTTYIDYEFTSKASFRLKEADEYDKVMKVTKRCTILAILSWIFCCGCLYSCLCFLPLVRKNFVFHNHENSFLEDTRCKYVKSFKGNRFKDSPYRRVRKVAERGVEFGLIGCCAVNLLIMFWVVCLVSSTLAIVLVHFFNKV